MCLHEIEKAVIVLGVVEDDEQRCASAALDVKLYKSFSSRATQRLCVDACPERGK